MLWAANRGFHNRGYLPHVDHGDAVQHVVFRLANSLPPSWSSNDRLGPSRDRFLAEELLLDMGHGSQLLANAVAADEVERALLHHHGERHDLIAWCVMPTHVHVLTAQRRGWPLGAVVQAWKSVSARTINRELARTGPLWAPDYFDQFMRDDDQLGATRIYIEDNPVKAGLCGRADEWPWSSARRCSCAGEGEDVR